MVQHIVVVPSQEDWPIRYQEEAALLRQILGPELLAIHHIGSTAVPGLEAKPIIDILPVVQEISRVDIYQSPLEAAGYEYLGEFGLPGRRYLRKGGVERTHQVHFFGVAQAKEIQRHLAVRDYLRSHPQIAAAYGALKEKLTKAFPWDIDGYCQGKAAFMEELEQEALAWQETQRSEERMI